MQINDQTQAVLLLTAWLGKPEPGQPQPLGNAEWARLATWLHENGRTPAELLVNGAALEGWHDAKVPVDRIQQLLERSAALAISVERWQRAGLWILSRSDPGYPRRLRQRLKANAPPILYGAGNVRLLEAGGVAIVGSRKPGDESLAFTSQLGALVAHQATNVVSGGASGVDETAMIGALEAEGTAVGVLAENLLRASSSGRWRRHLADGNLALVSPFNPEARFTPANAMARNKYVYCLADSAVVVASAAGSGGTWAGATETLRQGWVPVWVRPSQAHAGNVELIRKGTQALPVLESLDVARLAAGADRTPQVEGLPLGLPSVREEEPTPAYAASAPAQAEAPAPPLTEPMTAEAPNDQPEAEPVEPAHAEAQAAPAELDFYALFLCRLRAEAGTTALTVVELQQRLELTRSQLDEWLKRAVTEGQAEKLARPVRYQAATHRQTSLGL